MVLDKKELRMITYDLPEVRKADGEPTKIIGYAVKWDQLSVPIWGLFQERFKRGAFSECLVNPDVYAAWQHDVRETLGRTPKTLTLLEDDIGLRYEIIPPSWAEKHIESIERGDVKGSSFIFKAVIEEWDDSNPDMSIRTVTKAELYEVSPVTSPAYPQSSVGTRSAQDIFESHRREIEEFRKNKQDEAANRQINIMKMQLELIENS